MGVTEDEHAQPWSSWPPWVPFDRRAFTLIESEAGR